ncbi:32 kDa beta-galactoside-binding lectin lec-3 [Phlebotomus argentipes]|uniref:32 kDa beta-galactoside-binding lectin lec-3 n=1 Tax=Phlebotomus argentipes TaxID=94469 RepID=UPI002893390D|nr:32 kDa beta-galactoside-binding lectin lec-3 [Phlebotomus argentipes]
MLTFFTGNIFCTVEPGHIFVIGGKSLDGASRLNINLASGKGEEAPVPLTLSVRFHEDMIVRNTSHDDGSWGHEEREDNLDPFTVPNPMIPGDNFKVYILVGDYKFHIAVNGRPYCTYAFRTSLEEIRCITITNDIQVVSQIDHRQAFPTPYPPIQFDEPRLAFSNDVPKPFSPGHVIVITGIPYGNPRGLFIMKFTEGETKKQALHFNPRFEPRIIVRNSMNDSLTFFTEERDGEFPFAIEQQFKLAIAFTTEDFRFAVDGNYFGQFAYRSANVLDHLNGFKINVGNGLQLDITGVDHMNMGIPDCEGFEAYSHPDVAIM